MKDPIYAIQASWMINKSPFSGYVDVNTGFNSVTFVSKKIDATLFKSKVLAYGWMLKAKALYKTYKFSVITL